MVLVVKNLQVVLVVKNLPASAGDVRDEGLILGQENPLEEGVAVHSSILACRIPWTEDPGGLQPMGLQRAGHCRSDLVQHSRSSNNKTNTGVGRALLKGVLSQVVNQRRSSCLPNS